MVKSIDALSGRARFFIVLQAYARFHWSASPIRISTGHCRLGDDDAPRVIGDRSAEALVKILPCHVAIDCVERGCAAHRLTKGRHPFRVDDPATIPIARSGCWLPGHLLQRRQIAQRGTPDRRKCRCSNRYPCRVGREYRAYKLMATNPQMIDMREGDTLAQANQHVAVKPPIYHSRLNRRCSAPLRATSSPW